MRARRHPRRGALHIRPEPTRPDDAGDVRAVSVAIHPRAATAREVHVGHHTAPQRGMVGNAAVDDGHANAPAGDRAQGLHLPRPRGLSPRHGGGHRHMTANHGIARKRAHLPIVRQRLERGGGDREHRARRQQLLGAEAVPARQPLYAVGRARHNHVHRRRAARRQVRLEVGRQPRPPLARVGRHGHEQQPEEGHIEQGGDLPDGPRQSTTGGSGVWHHVLHICRLGGERSKVLSARFSVHS